MSSATFFAICWVGLSLELELFINSNTLTPSLGRSGGVILIPSSPTITKSSFFTSLTGTQNALFPLLQCICPSSYFLLESIYFCKKLECDYLWCYRNYLALHNFLVIFSI